MWTLSILIVQMAIVAVQMEEECLMAKESLVLSPDSPGYLLMERSDLQTPDECFRSCCDLRANGEGCNAASFVRQADGSGVCINAICRPFTSCIWDPADMGSGASARVAIFDTDDLPKKTVDFNSNNVSDNYEDGERKHFNETGNSTGDFNRTNSFIHSTSAPGLNGVDFFVNTTGAAEFNGTNYFNETGALVFNGTKSFVSPTIAPEFQSDTTQAPDELDEAQIDQIFNTSNLENDWNVEGEPHTTTRSPWGWQDSDTTTAKDSGKLPVMPPQPGHPSTHGNSGIYGPTEVYDFDYTTTPIIVIGAVMTVLLMLIILICIGRKLTASERLKYRPLRDSFPSNNANSYHDID